MLSNKVVVVTGANGQLGRAVVAGIVQQGGKVALLDLATGETPPGGMSWQVDLTSLAGMRDVLDAVSRHFGHIDGLVNVAGGFRWQTFAASEDLAEWEHMFRTNLMTCATACKAVLDHLQRNGGGRIVNIGAGAANKAASGMGAYAASKAGVARLTEALADELKSANVTVNAILPSIIDTPKNRADMPDADFTRWVRPAEIASVVAFLLSDAASAVTGALIPVAGRV